MKLLKRLERGQSFVEMAIGMIILVVLLGGLFDVGRAFVILTTVENATGEGALYGATHPECLTTDHSTTICSGSESVKGRVREEAKPAITISDTNITVQVENGAAVTAGSTLRIDVVYQYSPVTPLGCLIWGTQAEVKATARQQVMSPPKPGYTYP
jgi:Flp pilus assembly protein TadG